MSGLCYILLAILGSSTNAPTSFWVVFWIAVAIDAIILIAKTIYDHNK